MIEINKIYNENCLDTMSRMDDNFIDLTVTSPPYDNLRKYQGYEFDFESIAKQLYRKTKEGGVLVWVVGDATINGSETGTSFKQALFFMECGFNLETMIYKKDKLPINANRYQDSFEYMFVLSKGKIETFNPIQKKCSQFGKSTRSSTMRSASGETKSIKNTKIKEFKKIDNVWFFNCGFNKSSTDRFSFKHPAIFPEHLAKDHIISWSNKADLVYDPFMGSGTVAKMAIELNRNYIGSEISEEYCKIIETRIKNAEPELF